jgi:hypothetical protein
MKFSIPSAKEDANRNNYVLEMSPYIDERTEDYRIRIRFSRGDDIFTDVTTKLPREDEWRIIDSGRILFVPYRVLYAESYEVRDNSYFYTDDGGIVINMDKYITAKEIPMDGIKQTPNFEKVSTLLNEDDKEILDSWLDHLDLWAPPEVNNDR